MIFLKNALNFSVNHLIRKKILDAPLKTNIKVLPTPVGVSYRTDQDTTNKDYAHANFTTISVL